MRSFAPSTFLLSVVSVTAALSVTTTAHAQAQGSTSASARSPAERDGVRLRGGLSLGAGPYIPFRLPDVQSVGGSGGLSLRLGVQFFHALGVYIQSTNTLGGIAIQNSAGDLRGVLMAQSHNALLASLTIAHFVELAGGPSIDYAAYSGCDSTAADCASNSGVAMGVHGRASINIGGLNGAGPRRTALNISADVHPQFFLAHPGGYISLVLGLGVEWY